MNRGGAAFPDRSPAESDAILSLTEGMVRERLTGREAFTALDVSNALKARSYPVRHREVAEVVRALWESGLMSLFDYRRVLIPVAINGGAKAAQAYLYLHDEASEDDYDARDQTAVPPVASDRARSLDDVVPAGVPLSPFATRARDLLSHPGSSTPSAARRAAGRGTVARPRSSVRRDGALALPRRQVVQMGWQDGDTLAVIRDAETDSLLVARYATTVTASVIVRVWEGRRVRIARTKLGLLTTRTNADFALPDTDEAAGVLRLAPHTVNRAALTPIANFGTAAANSSGPAAVRIS